MTQIYNIARNRLLRADLNWETIDIMVTAWAGVPEFIATDDEIQDIAARGFVELASSLPINNASVSTDGSAQTDQVVIPGVPVGQSVTWLTVAERLPTHGVSKLILFIDDAMDLPFDPNGLDIILQPDWLTKRGWFKP